MQWIRFIEGDQGDCLVVDELLADVLFSSAIYLVPLQISQHTFSRVAHFVKLRVRGACTIQQQPYSFSKFFVRDVRTILQQCGANHILSV